MSSSGAEPRAKHGHKKTPLVKKTPLFSLNLQTNKRISSTLLGYEVARVTQVGFKRFWIGYYTEPMKAGTKCNLKYIVFDVSTFFEIHTLTEYNAKEISHDERHVITTILMNWQKFWVQYKYQSTKSVYKILLINLANVNDDNIVKVGCA